MAALHRSVGPKPPESGGTIRAGRTPVKQQCHPDSGLETQGFRGFRRVAPRSAAVRPGAFPYVS